MADLDTASKLLEDLRVASFEAGKKELEDTQKYATEHGFEGNLMNWDVSFWSERMKEDLFDINDEKLRPYFALPSVLDGLFAVWFPACCLVCDQPIPPLQPCALTQHTIALLNIVPLGAIICRERPLCDFQVFPPPNSGPSGAMFCKAAVVCASNGLIRVRLHLKSHVVPLYRAAAEHELQLMKACTPDSICTAHALLGNWSGSPGRSMS
jgi:hypothetical protein